MKTIDKALFAKRLNELMHRYSITQKCLAKEIGVSEQSMNRYCKGTRCPGAIEMINIASELDVSIEYLVGINDDYTAKVKGTIDVNKALEYCEKQYKGWGEFGDKALKNIGRGDSTGSSFGAVAFAQRQQELYGYEFPNLIKALSKERN